MVAARIASAIALAVALAVPAAGVQAPDLRNFFASFNGLSMSSSDAAALANKEANALTACGVTVPMLQALKDALYSVSMLNFGMAEVRAHLLPLAYQHVSPSDLNALYQALYSVSALNLDRAAAQSNALDLGMKHVEPDLLRPLFDVLYSVSAINLPQGQAQQLAIDLAIAGADAQALKAAFAAAEKTTMSKDAALKAAVPRAVEASLSGLAARYANDGKLYGAREFYNFYGTQWLAEWKAGVPEKRTAPDGVDYRASEFRRYFGPSWSTRWAAAPVAVQRRLASDGNIYSLQAFHAFYGATWQAEWAKSYEMLDACTGLPMVSCTAQPAKCQWKWSGGATTSCIVKPLFMRRLLV